MTEETPVASTVGPNYSENRRRMAWLSAFSLTGVTIWSFLNEGVTPNQMELLTTVLWVHGAIVGAYMGFKMFERHGNKGGNG